ncbi:hypothetical protein Hanom_Chr17g01545271 [Helianthus anomalus]
MALKSRSNENPKSKSLHLYQNNKSYGKHLTTDQHSSLITDAEYIKRKRPRKEILPTQ